MSDRPEETSVATWVRSIQAIGGARKARNVPPEELQDVAAWLVELESSLGGTPTPADRSTLGTLGRLAILELRLTRVVFNRGTTRREDGEIKPALIELRQIMRLKLDTLRQLRFKGEAPKAEGLRDRWAETAQGAAVSEDSEAREPDPSSRAERSPEAKGEPSPDSHGGGGRPRSTTAGGRQAGGADSFSPVDPPSPTSDGDAR